MVSVVKIVIEHLEPVIGKWVILEYVNASNVIGVDRVLVTNFCPSEKDVARFREELEKFNWTCDSVLTLYKPSELIVLDPLANEPLKPSDSRIASAVVIGGILGDHPPKGRTRKLLTSRLEGATVRNIGDKQYSIDGAAYVAYLVLLQGRKLDEVRYVDGLTVSRRLAGIEHEIELPYRYPLLPDGRPLISEKLVSYLKSRIAFDELSLIEGKTNNHI